MLNSQLLQQITTSCSVIGEERGGLYERFHPAGKTNYNHQRPKLSGTFAGYATTQPTFLYVFPPFLHAISIAHFPSLLVRSLVCLSVVFLFRFHNPSTRVSSLSYLGHGDNVTTAGSPADQTTCDNHSIKSGKFLNAGDEPRQIVTVSVCSWLFASQFLFKSMITHVDKVLLYS